MPTKEEFEAMGFKSVDAETDKADLICIRCEKSFPPKNYFVKPMVVYCDDCLEWKSKNTRGFVH